MENENTNTQEVQHPTEREKRSGKGGKWLKAIISIILILAVLAGAAYFAMQKGWTSNLFQKDELKIDETANVVTEIKKISEFTSACFYEEIILRETKTTKVVDNSIGNKIATLFGKKEGLMTDEIVIIANGKVRGFNLKNLGDGELADGDIKINGDTLFVTLPKAEIFDVLVNPSDFDIYIEDGTWDEQKVVNIKNKAIDRIKEDAIKDGILEKATKSGVKKLTEMFKTFGFPVVKVTVEGQEVEIEETEA